MLLEDVVRNLPLLSAMLLYTIVAVQIWRDRVRTWTESFFVFGFFFLATYTFSDFLYFHSPSREASMLAAKLANSFLTISGVLFFLFTTVFLGRMKRKYFVLLVPSIVFIAIIWTAMVQRIDRTTWGWEVTYRNDIFTLWVAMVALFVGGAIWNLFRTYRIVKLQSASLGIRTFGIAASFTFSLAVALCTNVLFGYWDIDAMPVFSSVLLLPGLATMFIILPITWDRWTNAMRSWGSKRYVIKGAYMIYADGTLIAAKSTSSEPGVDLDIFSATLDVIQNFMRTSFPLLSGKWLKAIDHGDMRIILERGERVYLALVLTGEENDLLRREMKDVISSFESRNESRLAAWRGMAQDAVGTEAALETFFAKEALF